MRGRCAAPCALRPVPCAVPRAARARSGGARWRAPEAHDGEHHGLHTACALAAACALLGRQVDSTTYIRGDECLDALKDLQQFLHRDDPIGEIDQVRASSRDTARAPAGWPPAPAGARDERERGATPGAAAS